MYYRSKEWVNLCRRADLMDKTSKYLYNNCKLCSNHFEECMFYNDLRNRLKSDAKPTLFEIPNPPPAVSSKRRRLQREQTFTGPPGNSICWTYNYKDHEIAAPNPVSYIFKSIKPTINNNSSWFKEKKENRKKTS